MSERFNEREFCYKLGYKKKNANTRIVNRQEWNIILKHDYEKNVNSVSANHKKKLIDERIKMFKNGEDLIEDFIELPV